MRPLLTRMDRAIFGENASKGPGAIMLFGGVLAFAVLAALAFRADEWFLGIGLSLAALVPMKKSLEALRAKNL